MSSRERLDLHKRRLGWSRHVRDSDRKAFGLWRRGFCSGANADLVKRLDADEVLDYRTQELVTMLSKGGPKYDVVLDHVGHPLDLHKHSIKFLKAGAGRRVCPCCGGSGQYESKHEGASQSFLALLLGRHAAKFEMMALGFVKEEDQKKVAG